MKYFIELNEMDIKNIIAEHFDVPSSNVRLEIKKDYEGYGPMEHEVHVAKVVVEGVSIGTGSFYGGLRT